MKTKRQIHFPGFEQIPLDGLCANCHKHKANTDSPWIGDGNMLSAVHGGYSYWCDCCMAKAQLKYAQQAAKRVAKLKATLVKLKNKCT